ncbi:MAG: squalene/phytoene synthase family protein [Thermoanaerobaculia bacterium]|nr:squalene/phytoene synthase family protein [Thermoanaerobaculia bacterium]
MTADLDELLVKTSRTFALSIPLLPRPTREEVKLAYLMFRIADTFEDATLWPSRRKIRALAELREHLQGEPDPEAVALSAASWTSEPPEDHHQGYLELLGAADDVFEAYWKLSDPARDVIRRHLIRTVDGMSEFVSEGGASGDLELRDLEELRRYCYVVAGIVGEMLTDLFLLGIPELEPVGGLLRDRARQFGEGLQLVNVLKDSARDRKEGRVFLPPTVDRSRVFSLARSDLDRAAEYTLALQHSGAPRGLVEFNALPILLARASLDRVETDGAGSKLTRPEVFALIEQMNRDLDAGRDVVEGTLPPSFGTLS